MMASVSGSRSAISVPWPGTLSMSTEPRSASMLRRTTSMPTPRPDRLVTVSAVEKPGSMMSWNNLVVGQALRPRCTSPRSSARCQDLRRDRARRRRRATSITMLPVSW